jgi:hypothetical protein
MYKAGMPAQYGGRLSSVLDIKMNEGNNQAYNVSGGIGLISTKLNVEGPIQKGQVIISRYWKNHLCRCFPEIIK